MIRIFHKNLKLRYLWIYDHQPNSFCSLIRNNEEHLEQPFSTLCKLCTNACTNTTLSLNHVLCPLSRLFIRFGWPKQLQSFRVLLDFIVFYDLKWIVRSAACTAVCTHPVGDLLVTVCMRVFSFFRLCSMYWSPCFKCRLNVERVMPWLADPPAQNRTATKMSSVCSCARSWIQIIHLEHR